ncbi:MAG: hypothetical protein ACYCUY_00640 [Acidithiobacillus sp.]
MFGKVCFIFSVVVILSGCATNPNKLNCGEKAQEITLNEISYINIHAQNCAGGDNKSCWISLSRKISVFGDQDKKLTCYTKQNEAINFLNDSALWARDCSSGVSECLHGPLVQKIENEETLLLQ